MSRMTSTKKGKVLVKIINSNISFYFPETKARMLWHNRDMIKEHDIETVKAFAISLLASGDEDRYEELMAREWK